MMFQRSVCTLFALSCCTALAAACAKGVDQGGSEGGSNATTTTTTSSTGTGGSSSGSGGNSSSGSGGNSSSGTGGSPSGGGGNSSSGSGGADPGLCDNGFLDSGEECDQTNYGGETCDTLGFNGGLLACDPLTCMFDTTGCITAFCGNDAIDPGEDCDGSDLGGATCQSIGLAGGILACDNCAFAGCYDHYTQDFEGGSMPLGWTTSGDANWFITTGNAHGGSYSAESGSVSDYDITSIFVTLTYDVPGDITFWHKESTESGWDYLLFYIDGVYQDQWSGTANTWAQASYNVSGGPHTFEWRYDKDGSLSSGQDTVWVDDIVTQNGYMP